MDIGPGRQGPIHRWSNRASGPVFRGVDRDLDRFAADPRFCGFRLHTTVAIDTPAIRIKGLMLSPNDCWKVSPN